MGRKRKYKTVAEKQRAWRFRTGIQVRGEPLVMRVQYSKALKNERGCLWLKTPKGKAAQKRDFAKHKKDRLLKMRAYEKTEKGKLIRSRQQARRDRDFGFHPISFPLSVPFEWHHVNKTDVTAIPKEIHRAISHRCGDGKLEGVVG